MYQFSVFVVAFSISCFMYGSTGLAIYYFTGNAYSPNTKNPHSLNI